jgi:hypothetical protein
MLGGLAPGSYTVTAADVQVGGTPYSPSATSQVVAVAPGGSASVTVTYAALVGSALNLRIDGLYLVQSTQRYTGTVPLVAGKDGLLRVFALANKTNLVGPDVRVRLYDGTTLTATFTIPAPGTSVPTSPNEATLTRSWNVPVPGSLIRPGLHVLADVDPSNTVAESNEDDNSFPAADTPLALDVRDVPPFAVTFVPVTQSNGRTGGVGSSNKAEFLAFAERIHPIATVDAVVHAALSVDTTASATNGDAWLYILNQIEMLRVAEQSSRNYYGVLQVDYCSSGGLAGIGYIGLPSAVGWDCSAGGSRASVAAHEWGHNWGRRHSPCGGASDPDPAYPYPGGKIGVFGYDVVSGSVEDTSFSDIMGYCVPEWISDWTYEGVLGFRLANASVAGALAAEQPCVLVWGRVVNGRPVLEPAFELVTRPHLPTRAGPYTIEGRGGDGAPLFRLPFSPAEVADLPGGAAAFAFAVPLGSAEAARLATLRLTTTAGEAEIARPSAALGRPPAGGAGVTGDSVEARREPDGRLALRWDAVARPAVLVRDARTGEVLSVARGGAARLAAEARDVDLVLSDGVRSRTLRVSVPR